MLTVPSPLLAWLVVSRTDCVCFATESLVKELAQSFELQTVPSPLGLPDVTMEMYWHVRTGPGSSPPLVPRPRRPDLALTPRLYPPDLAPEYPAFPSFISQVADLRIGCSPHDRAHGKWQAELPRPGTVDRALGGDIRV